MTVISLITTYMRPLVTEICLRNLARTAERFQSHGITFIPFCTVSDPHNKKLCKDYSIQFIELPNKPIGEKMDKAIQAIPFDYDYLMNLGSDNILTDKAIDKISDSIRQGNLYSCYTDMVFVKGDKMKLYKSAAMFGAGRTIHRTLIDAAMRGGSLYGNKDRGLDTASFRAIKRTGFKDFKYLRGFDVIDIKTRENINSWDAYPVKPQPITDEYRIYIHPLN